jgi:hypothetical protein
MTARSRDRTPEQQLGERLVGQHPAAARFQAGRQRIESGLAAGHPFTEHLQIACRGSREQGVVDRPE